MTTDELRRTFPAKSDAWVDGYRNGSADRRRGVAWDVPIYPDGSTYAAQYRNGYEASQASW